MKRHGMVIRIVVVTLASFSSSVIAQNCTTGGSQSSFRMLQQERLNDLPRSEIASQSQASQGLFASAEHGDVYGWKLMSNREMKRYLKKTKNLADEPEKLAAYEAKHREKMLARAQKKGVDPATLDAEILLVSP